MRIGKSDVTDGARQWMFDWYCGRDFAPSSVVSKPDAMSYSLFVATSYSDHVLPPIRTVLLLFCRFSKHNILFSFIVYLTLFFFLLFSLFLSTPRKVFPTRTKQLNDNDTIVTVSVHKKHKLLFVIEQRNVCIAYLNSIKSMIEQMINSWFCPIFILTIFSLRYIQIWYIFNIHIVQNKYLGTNVSIISHVFRRDAARWLGLQRSYGDQRHKKERGNIYTYTISYFLKVLLSLFYFVVLIERIFCYTPADGTRVLTAAYAYTAVQRVHRAIQRNCGGQQTFLLSRRIFIS